MIMKVSVHAVNFTVDKKLVDFVQERMDKLEKYYDRVVSSDVFLKHSVHRIPNCAIWKNRNEWSTHYLTCK